jgi:hypothetical protein
MPGLHEVERNNAREVIENLEYLLSTAELRAEPKLEFVSDISNHRAT